MVVVNFRGHIVGYVHRERNRYLWLECLVYVPIGNPDHFSIRVVIVGQYLRDVHGLPALINQSAAQHILAEWVFVHLLIGEPERDNPSLVMQVLKQTVARRLLRRRRKRHTRQQELWNYSDVPERVWQRRFYDFNVFSDAKITEKLRYMHRNPVKPGLVSAPELWAWSSYRVYAFGERGRVNMDWRLPPYTFRSPKDIKSQNNASIPSAHPSKTAKSAAPTSRSHKRKST